MESKPFAKPFVSETVFLKHIQKRNSSYFLSYFQKMELKRFFFARQVV